LSQEIKIMSYGNAAKLLRVGTKAAGRMGVTLGEIAEMCECDRRTAQRITVALSDLFPETERWTDDDNRPRWRLPTTSIVAFLSPAPEELAVLARAIDKLEHDGAVNEALTLRALEEKVLANIPKVVSLFLLGDVRAAGGRASEGINAVASSYRRHCRPGRCVLAKASRFFGNALLRGDWRSAKPSCHTVCRCRLPTDTHRPIASK
jgi:hypothetical protein